MRLDGANLARNSYWAAQPTIKNGENTLRYFCRVHDPWCRCSGKTTRLERQNGACGSVGVTPRDRCARCPPIIRCCCHAIACMSCIVYHVIKCISFAYMFISCIRAFSPVVHFAIRRSYVTRCPFLPLFVCGFKTFSDWTETCHAALVYYR